MEIKDLQNGQVLLVSAKGVKGGKVQLMFAEKITNPNLRPAGIVGLLNASDERFSQESKPRYAWETGSPEDIKNALGIDVSGLQFGEERPIGKLNPTIAGMPLHIQITETTQGTDFEVANYMTRAKRAGADGDFILTADGQYIYVHANVVQGEAKHVFMKDTQRSSSAANTVSSFDSAIDSELEA